MNPQPPSCNGILVTEDHPQTANLLHLLLAVTFPDYRVSTVASGEEALHVCRSKPPELIIMDISLPGMNGIEATRQIKAAAPAVQVVIHSSLDADVYGDECIKAGATAYVVKAGRQGGLISAVSRLLLVKPESKQI